ncbi:GntR family transcriptional regulator [Leucobacter luti]|uniref:GntR family transcriptional regulator n=1 Tax=Leucobacter luti TaxID=340320 RepID=UPI0010DFFA8E|nr:GntR family transcriptional regulator [Leucobacter luti]MCW2289419.1 DNA-binding GntR family transcriptional regulator [Leucobacter luti]QYM74812.1 GntR family transcriptional regulator [Leucobacter luti]TCK39978.1 GntR family transcriptional regulator [Leucobacter luti]
MSMKRELDHAAEAGPESGHLTRGEAVYEWVRERIIDGRLPTGSRIRERDLAEEIRVSRVPIREAFPRLEAEGYIRTLPRRGAVVAPMALSDVIELFDVRASLEVLAARLAAARCAAGEPGDELVRALSAAEGALAGEDSHTIASVTSDFHGAIVDLAGNALLQDLMLPIRGRVKRLFNIANERDDVDLHREHRDLCDAIVRGQVERAAALALAHVEHSRADTVPIIERMSRLSQT